MLSIMYYNHNSFHIPRINFFLINHILYAFIIAVEMIRFYSWLKQILKRMDNKLNWDEISSILGDWIRKKISGKHYFLHEFIFIELCLNSFSIIRRTRETGAQ